MTKDFTEIFNQLKTVTSKYSPPLTITRDNEKTYELVSTKAGEFAGRKFDKLYFSSVVIQKNYVTLHFFPIYTHPQNFTDIPLELKKIHKGKACFNIKQLDDDLLSQVEQLLQDGFELYQKGGVID